VSRKELASKANSLFGVDNEAQKATEQDERELAIFEEAREKKRDGNLRIEVMRSHFLKSLNNISTGGAYLDVKSRKQSPQQSGANNCVWASFQSMLSQIYGDQYKALMKDISLEELMRQMK
jgi:hypothetical protein